MTLPGWYLFLQILFPAAIGIAGGVIGWAQWRTANQKVALDLFDRRLQLYLAVRDLNRTVIGSGTATFDQAYRMRELQEEARFLFKSEVPDALGSLVEAMFDLEDVEKELTPDLQMGPERTRLVRTRRAALTKVSVIRRQIPKLFLPYMRMHTRAVRSAEEWFREANERRNSERD